MDIRKTYFNIFNKIKILNRQRTTGFNGANESNYLLTGYRCPSAASSGYCLLVVAFTIEYFQFTTTSRSHPPRPHLSHTVNFRVSFCFCSCLFDICVSSVLPPCCFHIHAFFLFVLEWLCLYLMYCSCYNRYCFVITHNKTVTWRNEIRSECRLI